MVKCCQLMFRDIAYMIHFIFFKHCLLITDRLIVLVLYLHKLKYSVFEQRKHLLQPIYNSLNDSYNIEVSFLRHNVVFFLFIYFWLCWVFVAVQVFSSCSEQGYSLVVCGLLTVVAFLVKLGLHGMQASVVVACGLQQLQSLSSVAAACSSRAQTQQLWHMGLVDPWPVKSSWTRD